MLVEEEGVTGGAGAYVGVGVDFGFTIYVPPDIGKQSLGEIHPPEEVIQECAVDDTSSTVTPQNTVSQESESTNQAEFEESGNFAQFQPMSRQNFVNFMRENWLYATITASLAIVIPLLVNRRRRSQELCE
jgi:hypothetical protein